MITWNQFFWLDWCGEPPLPKAPPKYSTHPIPHTAAAPLTEAFLLSLIVWITSYVTYQVIINTECHSPTDVLLSGRMSAWSQRHFFCSVLNILCGTSANSVCAAVILDGDYSLHRVTKCKLHRRGRLCLTRLCTVFAVFGTWGVLTSHRKKKSITCTSAYKPW